MDQPALLHRRKNDRATQLQGGVIVSYTTITHPPKGFSSGPRTIALIELEDGSQVMGQLTVPSNAQLEIGAVVAPRMKKIRTNEQGLHRYDATYEVLAPVEQPVEVEFPGYVVALYGPSGVGKSTISKLMATMFSDLQPVPIVTTRKKKAGDDGEYQYVTKKEFERLRESGDIVACTDIPSNSEQRWYGYREADIKAIWAEQKVPVVITEQHLLEGLAEHFGRRSILSFGLLPPGDSKRTMLSNLLHRLRHRGRDAEEQIADRMKNAEADLDFFEKRQELFDHIIVNEDLDAVMETMKGHVMMPRES